MRPARVVPRVPSVIAKAGAVLAVAATAVLGFAIPASAHVSVNPDTATQGATARLTIRVPNESPTASTVKLALQFPQDNPIGSVSVKPVAGWTVDIQRRTLDTPVEGSHGSMITEVVDVVTWTAVAGGIGPSQYEEFSISAGPMPRVDHVIFKAVQTYSDGEVVHWIDEPNPAVAELEHPAPVLRLVPADAGSTANGNGGSGAALALGIVGTVLGAAAVALAYLAYRRSAMPR